MQIASASSLQRLLFSTGCLIKNGLLQLGIVNAPGIDDLIFAKIKSRLGGRVKILLSGGAPLAPHVEHFLKLTMCCPVTQARFHSPSTKCCVHVHKTRFSNVRWHASNRKLRDQMVSQLCASMQGYGLTETCGASFVSDPYDPSQASTVGAPVAGVQMRLQSIPDMGYDACADPPRGELLIRGPATFTAYHKRDDLTKEAKGAETASRTACFVPATHDLLASTCNACCMLLMAQMKGACWNTGKVLSMSRRLQMMMGGSTPEILQKS